ncbi:MAG: hypothetical protein KDC44_03785 [Phaeodactylibacter sp.]|nr:hypothetical protein [Phaeodactylibacter sp.]
MKCRKVQPFFKTQHRPLHLLFFLCFGTLLMAQEEQPVFEQYGEEKGYFSSMVNDLLEDRYGFIWIAAVEGLLQFDGYQFQAYPSDAKDSCTLSSRYITQIMEDRLGNIWAVTPSGLNCFDRQRQCFQRFFHVDSDTASLSSNLVFDIHEDEQGGIWVTTSEGVDRFDPDTQGFEHWLKQPASVEEGRTIQIHSVGRHQLLFVQDYQLMILDTRTKTQEIFPLPIEPGKQTADHIRNVRRQDDFFFICTRTGLWTWSPADGTFTKIQLPAPYEEAYLIDAVAYYGYWWLASRGLGLLQFDPETGDLIVHEARPENKAGIMDMHVRRLLVDRNQNLWIGSFAGLNRLNRYTDIFSVYHPMPGFDNISNFILRIRQDNQGGVWVYNRWQGLTYAASLGAKAAVLDYPKNEYWIEKDTKEVYCDRDDVVWLARGYDGLHRYDLRTKTWLPTVRTPELESVQYHFIIEDVRDSTWLWLSTSDGLCRLNRQTLTTEWYRPRDQSPDLGSNLIVNMAQFDGKKLWLTGIGYANGQIGYLDLTDSRFHFFPYDPGNVEAAPGGSMKRAVFTPDGMLWIASLHGLIRCDPKTNTFKLFTQQDGLADPQLTNLESDRRGHLWMTQDNNIYRYRPEDNRFDRFHPQAPVRFISRCSDYGLNDRIFFGTNNGVLAFFPDKADNRPPPPKVLLTGIEVLNKPPQLDMPVEELQRLELRYHENILSLEFVSLQFQDPELFSYAYRLDGFEKDWTDAGNERRAIYTNLDPGKYTFRVKAANSDGVWNEEETTLEIYIRPPWWATIWAYLLYVVLIFVGARMVYQTLLRRRLEKQEAQNLREMDEFKTNFFTNITHEFRTPLTALSASVELLLDQADTLTPTEMEQMLNWLHLGILGLQTLIDNLIESASLEAGRFQVTRQPTDLAQILREATKLMRPLHQKYHQQLTLELPSAGLPTLSADARRLTQVIVNLLANAHKYAPAQSEIKLRAAVEAQQIKIEVADRGPGVPSDAKSKLFHRFLHINIDSDQKRFGVGLGLWVVKAIVEEHGGDVGVTDRAGGGSIFWFTLPYNDDNDAEESAV